MTDLSPDPFIVSMVQVATTLPMFLLAVPAGALADIVDRRKFLIVAETADKRDANARASPSHLVPRAQQDSGSPAA
jgi:hypothetical protein